MGVRDLRHDHALVARLHKGKIIRVAPPRDATVRVSFDAIVTDVTRIWLLADVNEETWLFRSGTGLHIRKDALHVVDGQIIAPTTARHGVYRPETRRQAHAAQILGLVLRD